MIPMGKSKELPRGRNGDGGGRQEAAIFVTQFSSWHEKWRERGGIGGVLNGMAIDYI